MSNHLAVATVSAALRDLVIDATEDALPGVSLEVETGRPDTVDPADGVAAVSVFLYQVSPNANWRNDDLPTRRRNGEVQRKPQAALNLHYLLSFFGNEGLQEPERLLGSVVGALHARPLLTRQMIESVLLTDAHLVQSDLAEQIDLVRFVPEALNLEEMSKLWSVFFQTPYQLSVAYEGTVVLIEPDGEPARPTLPVRVRNLYVETFRQPVVDEVVADGPVGAAILPGSDLIIRGHNLRGAVTRLSVGGESAEPPVVQADEIRLPLTEPPFPAAALRAGARGLQVIHERLMGTPEEPHPCGVMSNVAAFVLRPVIQLLPGDVPDVTQIVDPDPEPAPALVVAVDPSIGERQRVELLLNAAGAPGETHAIEAKPRDVVTQTPIFRIPDVTPGSYLMRIRIDGAESLLVGDDVLGFTAPSVTVTP